MIINKLDGVILHFIICIAVLTLLNDFYSTFCHHYNFTLIILPLLNFITMTPFLRKDDLKKIVTHFTITKDQSPSSNNDVSYQ